VRERLTMNVAVSPACDALDPTTRAGRICNDPSGDSASGDPSAEYVSGGNEMSSHVRACCRSLVVPPLKNGAIEKVDA
jgi:hypothetical protein